MRVVRETSGSGLPSRIRMQSDSRRGTRLGPVSAPSCVTSLRTPPSATVRIEMSAVLPVGQIRDRPDGRTRSMPSGDQSKLPTVNAPLVSRRALAGAGRPGSTSMTCRCVIRQSWSTTSNSPYFLSRSLWASLFGSVIVNAMALPSGDHANEPTPSSTLVTRLRLAAVRRDQVDLPFVGSIRDEGDPVAVRRPRRRRAGLLCARQLHTFAEAAVCRQIAAGRRNEKDFSLVGVVVPVGFVNGERDVASVWRDCGGPGALQFDDLFEGRDVALLRDGHRRRQRNDRERRTDLIRMAAHCTSSFPAC